MLRSRTVRPVGEADRALMHSRCEDGVDQPSQGSLRCESSRNGPHGDTECVQATAPIELVGEVRHHDRRDASSHGRTSGAGTSVMDDGANTREQLVVRLLSDAQQVRMRNPAYVPDLDHRTDPDPCARRAEPFQQLTGVALVHRTESGVDPVAAAGQRVCHVVGQLRRAAGAGPPSGHRSMVGQIWDQMRAECVQ